jgi:hypothetical protein
VTPAETLMEIVPDSDELQIEARLPLNDIDHVHAGQQALVKFSAFNQRTTPQLNGVVSFVSADATRDRQTNATYYTVRVTLPGEERRRLGTLRRVRHADRGLSPDRQPHHDELPAQADHRPAAAHVHRAVARVERSETRGSILILAAASRVSLALNPGYGRSRARRNPLA